MRLEEKQKCAICKVMTDFPEAHFLDFHYGRMPPGASKQTEATKDGTGKARSGT